MHIEANDEGRHRLAVAIGVIVAVIGVGMINLAAGIIIAITGVVYISRLRVFGEGASIDLVIPGREQRTYGLVDEDNEDN